MPPQTVESRLENFEKRVTPLEQLPGRVDELASQILQLRTEMRGEFSAVRSEMAEGFSALQAQIDQRANDTRVLHEEVLTRIALLQEGAARDAEESTSTRRKTPKRKR